MVMVVVGVIVVGVIVVMVGVRIVVGLIVPVPVVIGIMHGRLSVSNRLSARRGSGAGNDSGAKFGRNAAPRHPSRAAAWGKRRPYGKGVRHDALLSTAPAPPSMQRGLTRHMCPEHAGPPVQTLSRPFPCVFFWSIPTPRPT
ncbi:hypothetical protein GCM10007301_21570 [Azorhizobium oxalatiphilum]|uniref:Uncharacterized protein n=1 Tax=Azorhizobium oxalatiphilum TaxID=980631 RepID=A0A917BYN6_9HYPH|nr:hypothetical protein GCM10007301_21570 [Azorhizobium oxalatiphilum]